jgi:uncharacterized GH25 family protein
MIRVLSAPIFSLAIVSLAQAHFPFIVPDGDGAKAKVIFSDTLDPDARVNIEKIANTKLTLRDGAGKDSPLEWSKNMDHYLVNIPRPGQGTIFGVTDYGVLQKGEGKPFRLQYYPKAILGSVKGAASLGEQVALEVLPVGDAGKLKFQLLAAGKPVADAEVSVIVPGGTRKAVKTDAEGFTPAFEQSGRFGVYARRSEMKSGEHAGQKYDEVRQYASLVVDVGAK